MGTNYSVSVEFTSQVPSNNTCTCYLSFNPVSTFQCLSQQHETVLMLFSICCSTLDPEVSSFLHTAFSSDEFLANVLCL